MYGYIYKTTNIINGKIYIGKHKSNIYDSKYYGSGIALKRAIKKYGKENFINEMLCTADSLEELNKKEKEYIVLFDSQKHGYNIAPGGDGGEVWGDPQNHPSLGKRRLDIVGDNNPMHKKPFSKEIREYLRKQSTGRRRIIKNDKIKSVKQDELKKFLDDGWILQTEITAQKRKEKTPKNRIGWHHSEESKKKISDKEKQTKNTVQFKKEQSERSKKSWLKMNDSDKEIFRMKCIKRQLGVIPSEETRKKRSETLKELYSTGKKVSHLKGKQPWNKGRKLSEEEKQILAQQTKGRIHITDGVNNKMIYPEEFSKWECMGFKKGRTIHKRKEEKNNA